MLVITNAAGEIIAACHDDIATADGRVRASISPARPDHKMYLVSEVPDDITSRGPVEFRKAITELFYSKSNVEVTGHASRPRLKRRQHPSRKD
jgi:hypothetical protein